MKIEDIEREEVWPKLTGQEIGYRQDRMNNTVMDHGPEVPCETTGATHRTP